MPLEKSDILILGATGFTGGLITRYLSTHPQRAQFTLAVGARSQQKLEKLVQTHKLTSSVRFVRVDVTNIDELDAAVKSARVVINTVGPYWTWGTPVVRACARNGVHYVDLTGEPQWVRQIILSFDFLATKTGSIIVPACGFDSVPSDISAYLANKTLKSLHSSTTNQPPLNLSTSTSAFHMRGGVSGGTVASFITSIEDVPRNALREAAIPYIISPFVGLRSPPQKLLYKLAVTGAGTLTGGPFVMATSNKAIVQRTFGLLQTQEIMDKKKKPSEERVAYGPDFCYDEFMVTGGTFSAIALAASIIIGLGIMMVKPFRSIIKPYLPKSGDGPSDEYMEKGFFKVTNISKSDSFPPVEVKTVIKGRGDGGYLLTAIMISESALCFLLPPPSQSKDHKSRQIKDNTHTFSTFARQGGVLTPMSAFGDQLIQRLEESGRFEFSSSVVGDIIAKKVT